MWGWVGLYRLCWRMTFLVEWCVPHAFFLMSFDDALPSQQASQALSCIVGASPCGCPRVSLQYFSLSPAESFMVARCGSLEDVGSSVIS